MATIAVLKKETRENVPTKRKRPEKQVDIIPKAYMDFIYIWLEILMIVPAIVVGTMHGVRSGFEMGLGKMLSSYQEMIKRD